MHPVYKALLTDIDGTLIPVQKNAVPSAAVREAISKVKGIIHVGVATSRPLFMLDNIFSTLELSGPCIISGGTQIYDASTKKIVWEKTLDPESVTRITTILQKFFNTIYLNDGNSDIEYSVGHCPPKVLGVFVPGVDVDVAERVHKELLDMSDIAPQRISSHIPGKVDLDVTHGLATKLHGVLEVSKILNIDPKEMIGVGDGYNDFPLLTACGFGVAMGNAVGELKEIADYIAPTVDEDGLAHVIDTFVLH